MVSNGFVFVSGIVALDPVTGQVVPGSTKEQTRRVLESIEAILGSAGSSLQNVAKTTVYLKDSSFFKEMNETYSSFFGDHKPARTTVVCDLPKKGLLVEMDVIAVV